MQSMELSFNGRRANSRNGSEKHRGTAQREIGDTQDELDRVEPRLLRQQEETASQPWTSTAQLPKLVGPQNSPPKKPAPRPRRVRRPRVPRRRQPDNRGEDDETQEEESGLSSSISEGITPNHVQVEVNAIAEDQISLSSEPDEETDDDDINESSEKEDPLEGELQHLLEAGHAPELPSFIELTSANGTPSRDIQEPASQEPIDLTRSSTDPFEPADGNLQPGEESAVTRDIANSDSDETPFVNPDVIDAQNQPGMQEQAASVEEMGAAPGIYHASSSTF
ncbi:MAG: hypothetical protein M1816_004263 [Peltula sp. TS41687]|nr:MAG: hypothetical protein M1816_004263 [Peltula sp. TS41687]